MAETVKKSRIVSDEDNLEESLLEEFNLRLKNCMSQDELNNSDPELSPEHRTYENLTKSTQDFIHMEKVTIESDSIPPQNHSSIEHPEVEQVYEDVNSYENVEVVEGKLVLDACEDLDGRSEEDLKSVKDRMLLCTDDASCLLFTQTVTSPMLTPSEENIDFLKGFRRGSSQTTTDSGKVQVEDDKEEQVDLDEHIYENAGNRENIYENIGEVQKQAEEIIDSIENKLYEKMADQGKMADLQAEEVEHVYQEIEEEAIYQNIEEVVENQLEVKEEKEKEEIVKVEEEEEEKNEVMVKENYTEFIYHNKEGASNYCEKYNELLSKNAKNAEVCNREKDTESVPEKIVQNLKSQFLKGDEVKMNGKKEVKDKKEVKHVDIMKQINRFEKKEDVNGDSTVTESYTETTTFESGVITEKGLKKKKSKKSRKEEKENISVNEKGEVEAENFYNVNVKNLKSSFNKFDALQKKNVLHVRSSDASKAQEKFNGLQDGSNCKACEKPVFQMEQIKAERAIWHKNCFRCTECSKQLTVDTYESHEGFLFCKPHFKALFAPKVVEEEEQPPSDKPDLGLEELQSLNVKERFQVFENFKAGKEVDVDSGPVKVEKSQTILSKLARFQAKGMDIGVTDDSLNGIPIEESSSEEEVEEGEDADLVRAKRVQKEKPFHFTGMSDVKNKWEHGDKGKEERKEERKQEIQSIRNRLFMGKQGKMKEMYQQAVLESESCVNLAKKAEQIELSCDAKSIKDKFEKGEVIKEAKKNVNEEEEVYESEISKKSRFLFLELDANASKPPSISPITPPKLDVKKAREGQTPEREVYRDPDVVRAEEFVEDSVIAKETHTATKMLNKFRQMEENLSKEPVSAGPKPLKRFTPPPEPARVESNSEPESGSEEEEEEDVVDNTKIDDLDLLEAKKAARAQQLRAKFEKWEANEIKREQNGSSINVVEEYGEEQSQVESAKTLRARFESMRETTTEVSRTPRVKVNRFIDIAAVTDVCQSCKGKVYPLEKISVHGHIYHKRCFKCMECSCVLRMDSYSYNQGLLYCLPHFKRLFISKGNYDTGFGLGQHKEKWNANVSIA